jgi:hypothetical protein
MEAPYPQSSTFQSADQPLRVWSALPGFGALKVGNSVGSSSLPARPMEAPYPQSSTFQSADQPFRVWSALPGFGALKVGNSVGSSSLPARPMEGFKIGRVAFARRPDSRFPAEKAKSRLACKASPTESQSSNLLQLHLKLSSNIP